MEPVEPAARILAATLTASEAGEAQTPLDLAAAAQRLWHRLHHHFSKVLGVDGFRTILDHSLAQTRQQFPWLIAAQTDSAGTLTGLSDCMAELSPTEAGDGLTSLLAHFIQALAGLVGVRLALRLMQRTSPEIDLSGIASRWEGARS